MSFPDRSDIDKPQTWSTFKTFILALWDKSALAEGFQITASAAAAAAASSASTTQALRDSFVAVQGSIGYLPPVAYAAGINLTLPAQTVGYLGQAYAPILSALPFTTSGTFETAKFRVIQGVSGADLAASGGSGTVGHIDAWTGAIPTTLQFAVRDRPLTDKYFGLVGNNSFDNSVKISDAFGEASLSGRVLNIGPGTFLFGSTTLPNNTKIVGAGRKNTVLKAKAGLTGDFLVSASLQHLVMLGITIDGNGGANPGKRAFYAATNANSDGPAWVMRDCAILNGGFNGGDGSSGFVNGLCWVDWYNVRFIGNNGSLLLAVNDSVFSSLYVGNSGLLSNTCGLNVVGISSNQFINGYFGGCGNLVGSLQIPQVIVEGCTNTRFLNCTNDSAQGHGYVFRTWAYANYGNKNCSITGGLVSNSSQGVNNTYNGVMLMGDTSETIISNVHFTNPLHGTNSSAPGGAYAIVEQGTSDYNLATGCVFDGWQSGVHLLSGANSAVRDCMPTVSHSVGNGPLNLPYSSAVSQSGTWVPLFTGLTVVNGTGGVTYDGQWTRIGNLVTFSVRIITSGNATTASTAGTTYSTLPFIPARSSKNAVTDSGLTDLGGSTIYTNGNNYCPTWSARGNYIFITGSFFVS